MAPLSVHSVGDFLCSAKAGEGPAEAPIGIFRDLPDGRGVAELDHGLGVDGLDDGVARVLASADNDVAGKQRTEFRLGREGAAGQGRVAGAKDDIVTHGVPGFGSKFGLEGGADVDLSEDSEALFRRERRGFAALPPPIEGTVTLCV